MGVWQGREGVQGKVKKDVTKVALPLHQVKARGHCGQPLHMHRNERIYFLLLLLFYFFYKL